jgi:hypothetical protein
METTFNWSLQNDGINVTNVDGHQDLVVRIDFKIEATHGVNVAELFNSIELARPASSDSFIPFSELTEELVIGWAKAAVPPDRIAQFEKILNEILQHKRTPAPVIAAKKAPWNTCSQG